MRIGQGQFAAKKWHRGLSEAEAISRDAITAAIIDDAAPMTTLQKGVTKPTSPRDDVMTPELPERVIGFYMPPNERGLVKKFVKKFV